MHIPSTAENSPLHVVLMRATTSPEAEPPPASPRTSSGRWTPSVDVKVADKEVVVYADLPGIDEDELMIDILPKSLTIEGSREFDHDQEDADEFVRIDRPYGPFLIHVELPLEVDPNLASAKYRRGVLRVRMPLTEQKFRGRRVHP